MSSAYTVVIVYNWNMYGGEIKKIIHNHKLKWNSGKVKDESIEVFKKFKVEDDFKLEKNANITSGIWENSEHAIKIIKMEGADEVLLIYRGIQGKFYIELMSRCKDIGCLIQKIVDNDVIFRNMVNVELLAKLSNVEAEKIVKRENFMEKVKIIGGYSDEFIGGWSKEILK